MPANDDIRHFVFLGKIIERVSGVPVPDDAFRVDPLFAEFGHDGIDYLVVSTLQLLFTAFVALFVFLGCAELERRPLDHVRDQQAGILDSRPFGGVFQRPAAAITAIHSNKKNQAHGEFSGIKSRNSLAHSRGVWGAEQPERLKILRAENLLGAVSES